MSLFGNPKEVPMKSMLVLAALALAAPAAMAQTDYGVPRDSRLSHDEYLTCLDRGDLLRQRRERIEDERAMIDREAADIARAGAALDAQLRALDRRDATALADYNARSERHNRRVDLQNRRVADLNARAALMNGDAADMNARCESRVYTPYDRDADWRDRTRLR
jgi:hypothetical protein